MSLENRQLVLNWPASKPIIARFTRDVFENEYEYDREFFLRTDGGAVEGLLFDLGHYGRAFADFPLRVPLLVSGPRQEKVAWRRDPNLIANVLFPQFYDQITSEVEKYIVEVYRKKIGILAPKPDACQTEIDSLKALAEQCRDRIITVTFIPYLDDNYEIKRMKCGDVDCTDPYG